jgi:hypothetical protein
VEDSELIVAIAAFRDRTSARHAVEALHGKGFHHRQTGLVSSPPENTRRNADVTGRHRGKGAVAGLIAGAILGAVCGGALGEFVSSTGYRLESGLIAGLICGAVVGLIVGALTGLGMPRRDPLWMERQDAHAPTIVMAAAGDRWGDACDIMLRHEGTLVGDGKLVTARTDEVAVTGQRQPVAERRAVPVAAGAPDAPPPPPPPPPADR